MVKCKNGIVEADLLFNCVVQVEKKEEKKLVI